jgi:oligosaccharide repeat unit polymerase
MTGFSHILSRYHSGAIDRAMVKSIAPVAAGVLPILLLLLADEHWAAASLSIFFVLFSVFLVYMSTRTLTLISPCHVYLFFYMIYFYPWALAIFLKGETYSIGEIVLSGRAYDLLLAATLGVFCFSLGAFLTTALTGFRPKDELRAFRSKKWIDNLKGTPFYISIFILVSLSFSLAIIFFIKRGIPILAYSDVLGSAHFFGEMGKARIDAQWGAGYFMQGIVYMLPFSAMFIFAKGFAEKSRFWTLLSVFIASVTILMMISLTSRGHFAIFLILIFLLQQLLSKKVNWNKGALYLLLFVVLFLGVSIFKMGYFLTITNAGQFLSDAVEIFAYRLGIGTRQFHAILNIFPEPNPFLLGNGYLWDIASFLPGPDIGFNAWIFSLIYPFSLLGSTVNPLSVGELYANFGWVGIIIGSFLLGAFLQVLYIKFIRSEGKLSHLVLFIILSTYLAKSFNNGLGAILEPFISIGCSYLLFKCIFSFFQTLGYKETGPHIVKY